MTSHTYSYAGPLNSNLVCCICQTAFLEPVTTRTCTHTFCRACITHALSISPHCPVDRSPLTTRDLSVASQAIRNLVDELIVDCPHRESGCLHTCERYLLDTHLRDDCGHSGVSGPHGEYTDGVPRKDLREHRCRADETVCDNCGEAVKNEEVAAHSQSCVATCLSCQMSFSLDLLVEHRAECPSSVVTCNHAPRGCSWSGTRETLHASHLPSCTYEVLKGFFQIYDRQLSALAEENAHLRRKFDALEGLVNVIQLEMSTVKDALGPWYRPEHASQPYYPSGSTNPTIQDASMLNAHPNSDSFGTDDPPPDVDLLAPFFASLSLDAPAPSNPSYSSPSHHGLYDPPSRLGISDTLSPNGPPTTPGLIIPAAAHVAPLNLAAPLFNTLAGLRSSVLALAGAVDSATRRTNIALSADAARTGEELGALKAVVHGLRLQVHSLMVDRNAQISSSRLSPSADGEGMSLQFPMSTPMRYMGHPFPLHPVSPQHIPSSSRVTSTKFPVNRL